MQARSKSRLVSKESTNGIRKLFTTKTEYKRGAVGLTLGMDNKTKARRPLGKQNRNSLRKDVCLICLLVY